MSKVVVLISFVAAFAAGLVVGSKWRPPAAPQPATRPSGRGGRLAEELDLTAQQQEQINKIWAEPTERRRRGWENRMRIMHERRAAIAALIGSDKNAQYDEIQKRFSERSAAVERERHDAVAALLASENKAQYDEIQKRYSEQIAALDRELEESWKQAVDQTKSLLNAQQREKYETILKNRRPGPPPGGPDRDRGPRGGRDRRGHTREFGRSGGDRATSRPESAPQN